MLEASVPALPEQRAIQQFRGQWVPGFHEPLEPAHQSLRVHAGFQDQHPGMVETQTRSTSQVFQHRFIFLLSKVDP